MKEGRMGQIAAISGVTVFCGLFGMLAGTVINEFNGNAEALREAQRKKGAVYMYEMKKDMTLGDFFDSSEDDLLRAYHATKALHESDYLKNAYVKYGENIRQAQAKCDQVQLYSMGVGAAAGLVGMLFAAQRGNKNE